MQQPSRSIDFQQNPFIVIWEPTRACDLACLHCRAAAQPLRSRFELSTFEAFKLIDQIVDMKPRVFVITGGDPLKRPDLYQLVDYARRRGLPPSLTPSATPLLTHEALVRLKRAGLSRLAMSLDGSTAGTHDAFRGVSGSYDLTLRSILDARSLDIPVQVNTTITRQNLADVDEMVRVLERLDIAMWSVFFLVPTGRGKEKDMITPWEAEELFAKLYETGLRYRFDVKTTEAMHYRRFILQRRMESQGIPLASLMKRDSGTIDPSSLFATREKRAVPLGISAQQYERAPRGVNDANGFVFVSHTGEVYPSGFLPLSGGNVHYETLSDVYRGSSIFTSLRDPSLLKGKCGVCEFRELCGGSRARAHAVTGDPLEADPLCAYLPETLRAHWGSAAQS